MRPLRLHVRAFGPFAGEQTVDFAHLGPASLFLIHGPTGAGKSSLLDAICFALYGESSGGERRAADVRSHFAQPDALTEVTFEFQRGADSFRVHRVPEQERPKLRGEGTTTQQHDATVWRLLDDDWSTLATGPRDVADELHRILGFSAEQFRQVVVLPQGQFRRLLTAGSGEREAILSTLFHTREYARLASELHREKQRLGQEIAGLEALNRSALEEEGFESADELDAELSSLTSAVARLEEDLTAVSGEETEATKARDRARDAHRALEEHRNAQEALAALEARRTEMAELERDHQRAEQALRLADIRSDVSGRREDVERRARTAGSLREQLEAAADSAAAADRQLAAEQARGSERDAADRRILELEALQHRAAAAEEARTALQAASSTLRDRQVAVDRAGENLARSREQRATLEERRAADVETAAAAGELRLQVERLDGRVEAARTRDRVAPELATARTELTVAESGLETTEAAARAAHERSRELRRAVLSGQAGLLAETLEPGLPCPVCGATEHPAPATRPAHAPGPDDLDAAESEAARLDEARDETRNRVEELRRRTERLQLQLQQAEESLGPDADTPRGDLESAATAAHRALAESEEAIRRSEATARKLTDLDAAVTALEDALRQAEVGAREAQEEEARLGAVLEERRRGLPSDLTAPEAVETALAEARDAARSLADGLERAQAAADRARAHHSTLSAKLETASDELETAREGLRAREDALLDRLRKAGFHDEDDLRSALREPEVVQEMEQEIASFRSRSRAAAERVERAAESASGLEPPDLQAVEAALDEVKARAAAIREELTRRRELLTRLGTRVRTLREREAEIRRLDERYRLIDDLDRVANDRAMPFERFVLAAMLDDVLVRASLRLETMSRGRYQLRRDRGHRDARTAGGLDLVVFDGYTGEERPAATLSGGEGFLASLALALGLADSVQAASGGVHLETIFIDEGFGSLDPEALELAYTTLLSIHAEGRLVGVISHVPELRDMIPTRLEVIPTARGSDVRMVV